MIKKYKPGQLITIDKKVYRITKPQIDIPCLHCDLKGGCTRTVIPTTDLICLDVIDLNYLKLVKLCKTK